MALRVLLADESSTIKKVFQLALQDFAVEVRPVNIGLDVATVATAFKPDIIFADVLLQKKNGYDVCSDLKADEHLSTIPVVLMWSGFMEFDEDKFQASGANAQLEKPFDVAALRNLVTDLVPRTKNQRLSQFLTFPKVTSGSEKRPEIIEDEPVEKSEEDFTAVPIPKMKGAAGANDKYRLNLKPEELDPNHIPVDYDLPAEDNDVDKPLLMETELDEFEMKETKKLKKPAGPPPAPAPRTTARAETVMLEEDSPLELERALNELPTTATKGEAQIPTLSAAQLEAIVRQQSAEIIESVVWKVIPDLATAIIERELNRLLKERDSHPV
jgi:two-component system cell cycle response regulator